MDRRNEDTALLALRGGLRGRFLPLYRPDPHARRDADHY